MSDEAQSHPLGSVEVALRHATRLLRTRPVLAAEQATEILKAVPNHTSATLLLAVARRSSGDTAGALEVLGRLCLRQPGSAAAHYHLGMTLSVAGRGEAAVGALRRAVAINPDMPDAWLALADNLAAIGDAAGADAAHARHIRAATRDPRLLAPAGALVENRIPEAETLLRAYLEDRPTDVAALRMLAEVAVRLRRYPEAERLLERCLDLAPSFDAARHNYATVLSRQGKAAVALPHVERLLAREPHNPGYRSLHAAVLANVGDYCGSARAYETVLRDFPRQAKVWMSYGHSLKTAGRLNEAIAAYRRSLEVEPRLGEAWWSLANLKTVRFTPADVSSMRAALELPDLSDEDRLHFEFALGKALEDDAAYERSFAHYAAGSAMRLKLRPYDAEANTAFVRRARALFTREFFTARAGSGVESRDPIFILGLPRAGSTLLEQILASHSQVEGTMELPIIAQFAHELAGNMGPSQEGGLFEAIANLTGAELRALGQRYLDSTRIFRRRNTPFFIDKMPNNWLYVGLIHLILPKATIIDARRHPMACCFSCFKQHFARGQNFSYALEDLGRYYRDYVALMAHMDTALPGRVHRLFYERIVEDTEIEVRGLLERCDLAFETACLKFYENDRAVRTASSEQVRRPIFREALERWRHYSPWLGPLADTLGPVLRDYPDVPADVN